MDSFGPGDIRTAARGAWLFEQIVSTGTLVLKDLGGDRAGEVAVQRYLASPYVTPQSILQALGERTAQACRGRRIAAVQDTTEINFSGRSARRRGLGPGGDGKSPGFFIHPVVAVDAETEAVLGVVDAQIWTRGSGPASPRRDRAVEDKESGRWARGAQGAAYRLQDATQVVVIGDREADCYTHFARCPPKVELLVRARHDRALCANASLFETASSSPVQARAEVLVAPRPGEKGRTAQVVIRSSRVRMELGLVEVSEPDPPEGVKPLLWRLLTTLPVDSPEAAQEVVRLYRLRWRIEEVFRALKSDGLRLEDTQVQAAERLFRLSALALGAAVRTLQLVDAREGGPRPMSDVLDPGCVQAVAALSKSKERATARQKNPHPQGSLAWLAWVVARYGGWNCYGKPPGPKTMAKGWERFAATLSGFIIATAGAVP
jgi:hypothetical protein